MYTGAQVGHADRFRLAPETSSPACSRPVRPEGAPKLALRRVLVPRCICPCPPPPPPRANEGEVEALESMTFPLKPWLGVEDGELARGLGPPVSSSPRELKVSRVLPVWGLNRVDLPQGVAGGGEA